MPIIRRNIQWFGLLNFDADLDNIHWWRLTADMIVRPIAEFRNDGVWQPPRGFWGNVTARREGRVIDHAQLEFPNQLVLWESYSEAFLQQSISCQLDATLKSFENLGNSLGLIPFVRSNPVRDWQAYRLVPDNFSLKMQSENAVARLTLEWEELETCNVDGTGAPPPPSPPPLPPNPPLPPTSESPLPISPAYDGDTDNGETYVPVPTPPPPPDYPVGDQCTVYDVVITYQDGASNNQTETFTVYGEIFDIFYRPPQGGNSAGDIICNCRGLLIQGCQDPAIEVGFVLNGASALVAVESITPV